MNVSQKNCCQNTASNEEDPVWKIVLEILLKKFRVPKVRERERERELSSHKNDALTCNEKVAVLGKFRAKHGRSLVVRMMVEDGHLLAHPDWADDLIWFR